MNLALKLFDEAKIKQCEIISFMCSQHDRHQCDVHVTPEALIQIYHHFAVPRKFVSSKVVEKYAHILVPVRGCIFRGLVAVADAGQFLNSTQKQLPAPRAKRVAGGQQKCLTFSGGQQQ
jgi:hypothetical protein